MRASAILRECRRRSGLTQRELATRASTAQSVIARIERGLTQPSLETLERIVAAAGFSLQIELAEPVELDPQLLEDVDRILSLSPEERLREVANVDRFLTRAGRTDAPSG